MTLPVPSADVAPVYVVGFVGRTTVVPLPVGTETTDVREVPVPIGAIVTDSRVFPVVTAVPVTGVVAPEIVAPPEVVGFCEGIGTRPILEVAVPI